MRLKDSALQLAQPNNRRTNSGKGLFGFSPRNANCEYPATALFVILCSRSRRGGDMGKSDNTKERIARTFLECMETTPCGRINVSQICEQAHISRKTFYYHFEDKERLVRWICIQDLIEWAHSDTSDGPSSYISLISFFIEKNRILYGHALLDMTPGSFGQLFSDVLYYLIDSRLGRFYEESMANEELAHLSLAFAVDRGRMMASYWLLSDRKPNAEELECYLYQEEVVNNQIIGRWLNKPKIARESLRPPE